MSVRRARLLMEDALRLLDEAGRNISSAWLQQAIDSLRTARKPAQPCAYGRAIDQNRTIVSDNVGGAVAHRRVGQNPLQH